MFSYQLSEGLWVIYISLILMGTALFLVHKPKWQLDEIIAFSLSVLCYFLDTIWWYFSLDVPYTTFYFRFKQHDEEVTIFFILSGLFFFYLILKRLWRLSSNQRIK